MGVDPSDAVTRRKIPVIRADHSAFNAGASGIASALWIAENSPAWKSGRILIDEGDDDAPLQRSGRVSEVTDWSMTRLQPPSSGNRRDRKMPPRLICS